MSTQKNTIYRINLLMLVFSCFWSVVVYSQEKKDRLFLENTAYRLDFEDAVINHEKIETVTEERLSNKVGITLKEGVQEAVNGERREADISFKIRAPKAGQYLIQTYAVTDEEGAALMNVAKTKFESLFMRMQIGESRATKRVIYVPWDRPNQRTGIFTLSGHEEELKIWLPRGVRLEFVEIQSYIPPAIPPAAVNYTPRIIPPKNHPRLWVTNESLPIVKENLNKEENKQVWEKLKREAIIPFDFIVSSDEEVAFNQELELAAERKAFYYLMTKEEKIGREAVSLMVDYLANVEFGNLLDITREIGRAIYIGSIVYDWTYDLLTASEKEILRTNLMRLANDMEIGWPPFRMKILNGHGNEAIVNRDLLSMSIAIYNEDPLPYQYVSYSVLEELIPMRKFEYQSPRHNQGVNYGAYRFGWEMHNAWLYRQMTGANVFDDNIKDVSQYWLYMRTPNGQMLRDGDGFGAGRADQYYYWKSPLTMFLMYTYNNDPILKGEFLRQGELSSNPILFLLLNKPDLNPEPSLESLPLTKDFGPVLGSMIARTGWDIGPDSDDVVVEIKGGGYHFGNHQHSDAGSLQIYYRGFQLGDIGLYHFYGTPYDMGFNKRSISHSMMLVVDPDENFGRSDANDGGTRLNQRSPISPEQVQSDSWFSNGKVISSDFGPSKKKPLFSYFSVDLENAYSNKIQDYVRNFCFLNLNRNDVPAVIILTDDITTSDQSFEKYWQINSINPPEMTENGLILMNEYGNRIGKTYVEMLTPSIEERESLVYNGENANSTFNMTFEAPQSNHPERTANRILISPLEENQQDYFLTVFQVVDGDSEPLPVKHGQTEVSEVIYVADRVVSMNNGTELIDKEFEIETSADGTSQVFLCGLKAGKWTVSDENGRKLSEIDVLNEKNTLFFLAEKGSYTVTFN